MRTLLRGLALSLALLAPALARAASLGDCHIGAYALAGGGVVDIAPTDDDSLRWRNFDGTSGALHKTADGRWTSTFGWTDRPDGVVVAFSDCAGGRIRFGKTPGRRIAFDVTDVTFRSKDVDLPGRLVMPRGVTRAPIVVLLHGSENTSARDFYALQRLLPARGIGVFVYDKRGTGASGGKYTQDYSLLADDAVAALAEARRIAGPRAGRVGFQGGSQGGWIAPLAASRTRADFVVVSFGLAVSPIDEDRSEVELEMGLKGHSREEIAKALDMADAAETLIASKFTEGFEHYDALRARYQVEPWFKDLHGNLTRFLIPYSGDELREKGKAYIFGTPWHYDAMPVLRAATTPELWILGEDDLDAPSAETARRIKALAADGRPFTLALYPHAEHGMTEYELDKAGERVSTRFAPGYFQMMADFIRDGRLARTYGQSAITRPR